MYPDRVLPSIFISANYATENIVDGLAAGAQDYLAKPVDKRELIARVRAQLRLSEVVRSFVLFLSCTHSPTLACRLAIFSLARFSCRRCASAGRAFSYRLMFCALLHHRLHAL